MSEMKLIVNNTGCENSDEYQICIFIQGYVVRLAIRLFSGLRTSSGKKIPFQRYDSQNGIALWQLCLGILAVVIKKKEFPVSAKKKVGGV